MSPIAATSKPHPPEFKSVKQLYRRLSEDRSVSVEDGVVPSWQRASVWTDYQQGLLALSIIQGYPIGIMVLWDKGIGGAKLRVPVDGRQRIHAIQRFMRGEVAIPDEPFVPTEFRGCKYVLSASDDQTTTRRLETRQRDDFDDYELSMVEYGSETPLAQVMDIFVRLQGGTPLNKAEVRAALGGKVCDFVSELVGRSHPMTEDVELDEDEPPSLGHSFFQLLSRNLKDRRKSHRAVCDYLLAEFLRPDTDKHWQQLLALYREQADSLRSRDQEEFRRALTQFARACSVQSNGSKVLSPHLNSAFFIVTIFRAWRQLAADYALPAEYRLSADLDAFELERLEQQRDEAWAANFSSALSNAAYSKGRSDIRHDIFMSWLLRRHPEFALKDPQRAFSREQKLAIFLRADRRCEWLEESTGTRCDVAFEDFRCLDADHVVRWASGGPTSVANGRLLCQAHNRGRGDR